MTDGGDVRLEAELRAVAEARSRGLAGHPSPAELVDYHFGALPPEEADALQEHLAFCRECSQVVLDMVAFARPPEGEPAPPAVDLDREWDRLQARLETRTPKPGPRPPGSRPSRKLPWALAAASVISALGLLGWNLNLRDRLEEARRPSADIAMAHLAPERPGAERATEAPTRVEIRPEQRKVFLLLNLGDLREFPEYRMELADPEGSVLWAEPGVPRQEDGTFSLEIPAEMLEAGVYEVRLSGGRDGESIPLARYSFEVVRIK
jgi:Putative zinc-finger